MSINVYTCTQADLETLEGIGPKSAADIIAMRNEVLAGTRPKITINHLAAIRLQRENWQGFIDDGKLSIIFHTAKDEGELQTVIANLTNKNPLTEQLTTEHEQTLTGQTETLDGLVFPTQPLTGQTLTMTEAQNLLEHDPADISAENTVHDFTGNSLQDSVVMLAQQMDTMVNQINGLGTTLSQKLIFLSDHHQGPRPDIRRAHKAKIGLDKDRPTIIGEVLLGVIDNMTGAHHPGKMVVIHIVVVIHLITTKEALQEKVDINLHNILPFLSNILPFLDIHHHNILMPVGIRQLKDIHSLLKGTLLDIKAKHMGIKISPHLGLTGIKISSLIRIDRHKEIGRLPLFPGSNHQIGQIPNFPGVNNKTVPLALIPGAQTRFSSKADRIAPRLMLERHRPSKV